MRASIRSTLVATLLVVSTPSFGAAGDLSLAYGTGGKVFTDFATTFPQVGATLQLSTGKVLVGGYISRSSYTIPAIVRFNADGSLDATFGVNGRFIYTNVDGGYNAFNGFAEQADGKIVVAGHGDLPPIGSSNMEGFILRLNDDGTLDATFGTGGLAHANSGGCQDGGRVAVEPATSKIFYACYSSYTSNGFQLALHRFNTNGTPDTGFGIVGQGYNRVQFSESTYYFTADLLLQADGKIVVASTGKRMARFNTDGSVDTTFGTSGLVTDSTGPIAVIQSLAQQPDGKIVVAGYKSNGLDNDVLIRRYNVNGTLDATFNGTGENLVPIGSSADTGHFVTVEADGSLTVVARTQPGNIGALVRFTAGGVLDAAFGTNGRLVFANAIGVISRTLASGGVLAATEAGIDATAAFTARKFLANGSPDSSFASGGIASAKVPAVLVDSANALALRSNGTLVTAGAAYLASNPDWAHAGLFALATTSIGSRPANATGVAIQSDGNAVIGGHASNGTNTDFAVARYAIGGSSASLDTSFPTGGKKLIDFGGNDVARDVVVQSDFKVVLAGETDMGGTPRFALARYNPAIGGLDASFGSSGLVMQSVGAGVAGAYSILQQGDGTFLVGGVSQDGTARKLATVAKFTTGGVLDASFGTAGVTALSIGTGDAWAYRVRLQPDGKILIFGEAVDSGVKKPFVARLSAGGSPDASWGTSGIALAAVGASDAGVYDGAFQAGDLGVIAVGYAGTGAARNTMLLRLTRTGVPDTTLGAGGVRLHDLSGASEEDFARALAINAAGNWYIAGSASARFVNALFLGYVFAPSGLGFSPQSNVPLSTTVVSDPGYVGGITSETTISVSNGEYCISSTYSCTCDVQPFTSAPGFVSNNSGVCVRHTSSAVHAGSVTTTLMVNTVSASFSSTTEGNLVSVTTVGPGKVTSNPPGIDCGSTCSARFISNTQLVSYPDPGAAIAGWSACPGSYTPSCVVDAGLGDVSVTATFAIIDTFIDSGPSGTVNSTDADFTFSSNLPANCGFLYNVDGEYDNYIGGTTASLNGLAQGPHTLSVRVYECAAYALDLTPATRTWTVDSMAPDTSITGGPSGTVTSPDASFTFTSTEAGSTFECRLDAAPFAACTSPKSYTGLANGSYAFQVRATDGAGNADATPASRSWTIAAAVAHTAPRDFNDDGNSDLLWRDTASDAVQAWTMNGLATTNVAGLLPAGGGYTVTHVADLNGDGFDDLLIRHTDGTVIAWLMNGLTVLGQNTLAPAGSGYTILKVADLNGDGKADIFWQAPDGSVQGWLMDGLAPTSTATFVGAGSGWTPAQVADIDGDGKADILWQHTNGSVQAWLMNGLSVTGIASFAPAGSGWSVVLTGDFNGDGKSDLMWQHTDGSTQAWLMNGLAVTALASFTPAATGWSPVLAGDIDGDGTADLFWQHSSGASQTWLMNGLAVTGIASFVAAGNWSATHLLDLDGDGKRDIFWRNTDGSVQAWLMNGLTVAGVASLAPAGTYILIPPMP